MWGGLYETCTKTKRLMEEWTDRQIEGQMVGKKEAGIKANMHEYTDRQLKTNRETVGRMDRWTN